MREGITNRIALAIALGELARFHRRADAEDRLGLLPDGRPVVRLDRPLERIGHPGRIVAWGCSTVARADVYGPILPLLMEDMTPWTPATIDHQSPLHWVRYPTQADSDARTRGIGYVITQRWDASVGGMEPLLSWRDMLAAFGLRELSGTPEEQAEEIARAEAIERAAAAELGVTVDVEVGT